jgi:hypothetical protein
MATCYQCLRSCSAYIYAHKTGPEKYCLDCHKLLLDLRKALVSTLPDVDPVEPPLGWNWVGKSWFVFPLMAKRVAEELFETVGEVI